jgi:hypothetical protein
MGWASDTAEEFRKLPPAGKIAVGLTGLAVVGIGFYEYQKSKSSSPAISAAGTPSTDTQGAQTQGLPFLPFGTTALTDSSGNPVAFINPQTPSPATNPPPKSGPPAKSGPLFGSSLPSGVRDILGFHAVINGSQWTIVPGPKGRVWGVPGFVSGQTAANTAIGPNQKQLLVAPATAGKGGGPDSKPVVVQRYEVKENGHIHAHKYQLGQPMK